MRQLKRDMIGDTLSDSLPFKITNYGETIGVVLSIKDYNQLVRQYKNGVVRQPEVLPIYDKEIHKAGDRVLVRMGKRLVPQTVPEIDADGNLIRRL